MAPDVHDCLHPEVISGWLSLTAWAKILVPTCIAVVMALAGSAILVRVDMADLRSNQSHASERRTDNREELSRLRADLVRLERDNALRQTETLQSLTRLETKMESLTSRQDRNTRR